ncbi:hypothetical protein LINPERHAP1_LOCUS13289 [Linum perenne]
MSAISFLLHTLRKSYQWRRRDRNQELLAERQNRTVGGFFRRTGGPIDRAKHHPPLSLLCSDEMVVEHIRRSGNVGVPISSSSSS